MRVLVTGGSGFVGSALFAVAWAGYVEATRTAERLDTELPDVKKLLNGLACALT